MKQWYALYVFLYRTELKDAVMGIHVCYLNNSVEKLNIQLRVSHSFCLLVKCFWLLFWISDFITFLLYTNQSLYAVCCILNSHWMYVVFSHHNALLCYWLWITVCCRTHVIRIPSWCPVLHPGVTWLRTRVLVAEQISSILWFCQFVSFIERHVTS